MNKWCEISVICLILTIFSSQGQNNKCRKDSKCMVINKCTDGVNSLLFDVEKNLHCGFEGEMPKVCCPPQFRRVNAKKSLPNTTICGIQTNERIYGGQQTDIDEHPWMALLKYEKPKGSGFYCGGVLISHRHVLTAAHCIKGSDIPPTWKLSHVRLGEWNTSSGVDCRNGDCNMAAIDVPIESLIAHEDYKPMDGNQQNDIAIIKLSRDVQYTDFIKPICLPFQKELNAPYEGWEMEVAGWGKTETRTASDVKLKVTVPVINQDECKQVYATASRLITEKQMCAGGNEGQDSCRGDSGGSLMGQATPSRNWFVFGVVSYGPSPCGTLGWPGVYTRVTAFINWILLNLEF